MSLWKLKKDPPNRDQEKLVWLAKFIAGAYFIAVTTGSALTNETKEISDIVLQLGLGVVLSIMLFLMMRSIIFYVFKENSKREAELFKRLDEAHLAREHSDTRWAAVVNLLAGEIHPGRAIRQMFDTELHRVQVDEKEKTKE